MPTDDLDTLNLAPKTIKTVKQNKLPKLTELAILPKYYVLRKVPDS